MSLSKLDPSAVIRSIDDVIAMLPLLSQICRDIRLGTKELRRLSHGVFDPKDQSIADFVLDIQYERMLGYGEELGKLGGSICHAGEGCVDIPVWHPHLSKIVHACVDERTIKAHNVGGNSEKRCLFWNMQ